MMRLWFGLVFTCTVTCQERFAPGVPPQAGSDIKFHDPNEYQAPQQNQQQFQHQQQQPPNTQHQGQASSGHQGVHQQAGGHGGGAGGHHHDHQFGENLDQEHLEKHKQEKYVDTSKMSEREKIWYQFRNFDLDKDGLVDGMEIIKSILHYRGDDADSGEATGGGETTQAPEDHSMTPEELESFSSSADEALKLYDTNDDGYISYQEFLVKMLPEYQKQTQNAQNAGE